MVGGVCVVGGGVIGLSTALRLLEARPGLRVTVVAESFTPLTTGDGAAGLWQPYAMRDTPETKLKQWGTETFDHILKMAMGENASKTGSFLVSGHDIFRCKNEEPFWKDTVLGYRLMSPRELDQFPGYTWGYSYTTVMAEGSSYLPWLMERINQCGGNLEKRKVHSFDELSGYDVVVNCAGMGARKLTGDKLLEPMKGQLVRVEAPWIKYFLNMDDEDLHCLPGSRWVVLGGTHILGDESMEADPTQTRRIVEGCSQVIPSLKNARIVNEWTGFRPSRPSVRLEAEDYLTSNNKRIKVVHNYGHGGGGITLHWGCAKEGSDLVIKELNRKHTSSKL